jgi:Lysophospholipase
MNHISKDFVGGDGRAYKSHVWELREGGYRRIALLAGNGLWPVGQESRLVRFLLDRGFRVNGLDVAYGSPRARLGLAQFRKLFLTFAQEVADPVLPVYLIAPSFSAGALLPILKEIRALSAAALIGPAVEYPPTGLRRPLFFLPKALLSVAPDQVSGKIELLQGLYESPSALEFRGRDLKELGAQLSSSLASPIAPPCAAFCGEDDPFLSESGRKSLSAAGIKVYGYPRVRHEPGYDRYADNFYADLGSFLDEIEATRAKRTA